MQQVEWSGGSDLISIRAGNGALREVDPRIDMT
jgi:hypothetical protein